MKKKLLHKVAAKHGYKSNEDFYADFPDEESYIKKFGIGGEIGDPTIIPRKDIMSTPGAINQVGATSSNIAPVVDSYNYALQAGATSLTSEQWKRLSAIQKQTISHEAYKMAGMQQVGNNMFKGTEAQAKVDFKKGGYVAKYGIGGAIGTTVGTALGFIPGIGPLISGLATPMLSALGDKIEGNMTPEEELKKGTSEQMFTSNPYGFAKGGKLKYAGGGPITPEELYNYLISKGLSDSHAKGMLANVEGESSFNPGAIGDDGTSGGIFQHHNARFEALKAHAGETWATDWKKQVDFALSEDITKKYTSQSFKDSAEASTWFTVNWERPKDAKTTAAARLKNLDKYTFGTSSVATEPTTVPFNFSKVGAKADTLPNYSAKKYLPTFANGGDIPGKLIPLKQEGKFKELGNAMFYSQGPSHKKGGISAEVQGVGGMKGLANVELEGKEILMDDMGYIVRKDIADKYISALNKMKGKKDSVTSRTRDFLKNKMVQENEELLAKENKGASMGIPKAAGGLNLNGLSSAIAGYVGTPYANTSKFDNTIGDYAQLAGIALPAAYNLIKGSQDAEVVKPIYNPNEGPVESLMANRRYDSQATQNQITRSLNSGIGNINSNTNSASIRRSNVSNLISNAEQQGAYANLQGQIKDNEYASDYASTLNNLGGQRVAAEDKAQQMNYLNRGAKDAFTSAGITQLGQGLTEFGKAKNTAGYNNVALGMLNNAFPKYYFNTSIIQGMANGIKPSWMTDEEFAKAQTILYKE